MTEQMHLLWFFTPFDIIPANFLLPFIVENKKFIVVFDGVDGFYVLIKIHVYSVIFT